MADPSRFERALRRFDAVNGEDPCLETVLGTPQPKELLYGRRMSACLAELAPEAPETVQLAVRAQHLGRFRIPRDRFPRTREGYLRWRTGLAKMHAELSSEILREVGYGDEVVTRVQDLLRKRRLKDDPEVQLLEDVACLVFLEHYLVPFAETEDEAKVVAILQKTWRKMSERGWSAALALALAPEARRLVALALEPG